MKYASFEIAMSFQRGNICYCYSICFRWKISWMRWWFSALLAHFSSYLMFNGFIAVVVIVFWFFFILVHVITVFQTSMALAIKNSNVFQLRFDRCKLHSFQFISFLLLFHFSAFTSKYFHCVLSAYSDNCVIKLFQEAWIERICRDIKKKKLFKYVSHTIFSVAVALTIINSVISFSWLWSN